MGTDIAYGLYNLLWPTALDWNYTSSNGAGEQLWDAIASMYRRWRPYYTDAEITLSTCIQSTNPMVRVTGTMSSIYHNMVQISAAQVSFCSLASFSCTTLRIQTSISYYYIETGIDIQNISCNNELIHSLVPLQELESIQVCHWL